MTKRQQNILKTIIEEYIQTSEPIGSKAIEGCFKVSSATIRNEMLNLCKDGYLIQPHTSAGRVPTEKGYRYYLDNLLETDKDAVKNLSQFTGLIGPDLEAAVKQLAKALTELSGETVVVGLGRDVCYYTGLSNLFSKPEFRSLSTVLDLSSVLDQFNDVIDEVYDVVGKNVTVKIGSENPFDKKMSSMMIKCAGGNCLIGIIGPMRMNYNKNISLLKEVKNTLKMLYGER